MTGKQRRPIGPTARITNFYMDIHNTDLFYSHTACDVISYFQSEVIAKNVENTASDGLRSNFRRTG